MKKFCKFLLALAALAGLCFGAYYVFKNYIRKEDDDFYDFEDEFDDFEIEDELEHSNATSSETREYVTITPSNDETSEDADI